MQGAREFPIRMSGVRPERQAALQDDDPRKRVPRSLRFAALRVRIWVPIAMAARAVGTRRTDGVNGGPNAIDVARKQLVGRVCFGPSAHKPGSTTMLDAEEYFHLALHASAMGDHHACMTQLEEVLQRQPRNARAIYLLAVQHAELGLLQRAVAGIKTALMIEPDLELARFQLGLLLLFDNNEPVEAKGYLDRLRTSQNRALRAYAEAMIAVCDSEPTLARQKLAIGLAESSPDSPLALLMRRVFEHLLSRPEDQDPMDNCELGSPRSLATCPPSVS
jgi:tetratricopeptide (TPR) repeat protein